MSDKLPSKGGIPKARKPYESPRLFVHGDAAALTRSLLRLCRPASKEGGGGGFSAPT